MGNVSPNNQPDAAHPIRQQISATNGTRGVVYKDRADYCGNNIHAPN
jgi:hypothetical protein